MNLCLCVCVCLCVELYVQERERQRQKEAEKETEIDIDRIGEYTRVREYKFRCKRNSLKYQRGLAKTQHFNT